MTKPGRKAAQALVKGNWRPICPLREPSEQDLDKAAEIIQSAMEQRERKVIMSESEKCPTCGSHNPKQLFGGCWWAARESQGLKGNVYPAADPWHDSAQVTAPQPQPVAVTAEQFVNARGLANVAWFVDKKFVKLSELLEVFAADEIEQLRTALQGLLDGCDPGFTHEGLQKFRAAKEQARETLNPSVNAPPEEKKP